MWVQVKSAEGCWHGRLREAAEPKGFGGRGRGLGRGLACRGVSLTFMDRLKGW